MKMKSLAIAIILIMTMFTTTSANALLNYPYHGATHHATWNTALLAGEHETEEIYIIDRGVVDFPWDLVTDGESLLFTYAHMPHGGVSETGLLRLDLEGNIVQMTMDPGSLFRALDIEESGRSVAIGLGDNSGSGLPLRFLSLSPKDNVIFDTTVYADAAPDRLIGADVVIDSDGNAIGVGGVLKPGVGTYLFMAKIAPDGSTLWTHLVPLPDPYDQLQAITLGDDDSIYVTGEHHTPRAAAFVMKLDQQGEIISQIGHDEHPLVSPEGTLWAAMPRGMKFGSDGHLYISGTQMHPIADICIGFICGLFQHERGFVAKLDSDLEVVWIQNINVGAYTSIGRLDFHPHGDILVTGGAADSLGDASSKDRKQFVARVNPEGDVLWVRINDDQADESSSGNVIAVTPDGETVYTFGLIERPGTHFGAHMFGAKGPTESKFGQIGGTITTWENRARNLVYPPPITCFWC